MCWVKLLGRLGFAVRQIIALGLTAAIVDDAGAAIECRLGQLPNDPGAMGQRPSEMGALCYGAKGVAARRSGAVSAATAQTKHSP